MANMFTSYDNINSIKSQPCTSQLIKDKKFRKGPKIITNIKGNTLGVQVEHASPLQLYFHLENITDTEIAEIILCTTLFEILTTTHKTIVSHEYATAEILNQETNDLAIILTQAEMKVLKKEIYNLRVTLKTTKAEYEVFAEKDGYLVVR
jgi:hypothetical protein